MLEEILGRWSVIGFIDQTGRQEFFDAIGELIAFEFRGLAPRDLEDDLGRGQVRVGGITVEHLVEGDTEGPDVGLGIVEFTIGDDLGSHPVGRADEGRSFVVGRLEWGGDTKVAEEDTIGIGEKDVGRLDVTMDDILTMEIVEADQSFSNDQLSILFIDLPRFQ